MKLVPYTVMVPEHYVTFMRAMGEILNGFEEAWAMHFVDQVFQDDPSTGFDHCVALATGNYTFDTEKEKQDAQRLTEQACRALVIADAVHLKEAT